MERPRSGEGRGRSGLALGWAPIGMVSAGSDGEGVEVVGQDRPGGPGSGAVVAFESGSAQAVAAFEVADAAFGADPELRQAPVGLTRSATSGAPGGRWSDERRHGVRRVRNAAAPAVRKGSG